MPSNTAGIALLKALRAQIEAAEAGEILAEISQPLRNPHEYAKDALKASGITLKSFVEYQFTDIWWTRSGAEVIRQDMHTLKVVLIVLPNGLESIRCGFGYAEAVAIHGEEMHTHWLQDIFVSLLNETKP